MGQQFGPALIWDPVDSKAKPFNDPTIKDFAISGTYTVNGVQCSPAFQLLKDHVKKYTPESAEKITDVSAATIRRITKELTDEAQIGSTITIDGVTFPYRPANVGYNKAHSGSKTLHTQYAARLANMIIGSWNCPGGYANSGGTLLEPNPADGTIDLSKEPTSGGLPCIEWYHNHATWPSEKADTSSLYPGTYNVTTLTWYAINEPDKYGLQHPPKMYAFLGTNQLGDSLNPDYIVTAMKKIPFIWGISIQLDDMAEMCDIVLPDYTDLERYFLNTAQDPHNFTTYQFLAQPVLNNPVFPNTRDSNEITLDIAEQVGLLYGPGGMNDRLNRSYNLTGARALDLNKRYAFADIVDRILKTNNGDTHGLDYFKTNGYLLATKGTVEDRFGLNKWPTTRTSIYWEFLVYWREELRKDLAKIKAQYGVERRPSNDEVLNYIQPLPDYLPRPEFEAQPAEYDMYAIHYKTMLNSMATFMDNAWIMERTQLYDPYAMMILINTDTAKQKGIADGDHVIVESQFGKTGSLAKVTELIRPDTVAIAALFGSTSVSGNPGTRLGPLMNNLLWASEEYRDWLTGNQPNGIRVKVYKA